MIKPFDDPPYGYYLSGAPWELPAAPVITFTKTNHLVKADEYEALRAQAAALEEIRKAQLAERDRRKDLMEAFPKGSQVMARISPVETQRCWVLGWTEVGSVPALFVSPVVGPEPAGAGRYVAADACKPADPSFRLANAPQSLGRPVPRVYCQGDWEA